MSPRHRKLFFCVLLLYLPFGYATDWSETTVGLGQTMAIVDRGEIRLGPPLNTPGPNRIQVGDSFYSQVTPGLGYLLAPVYFILRPVLPEDFDQRLFVFNLLLTLLLAAPLGAATVTLFHAWLRVQGLRPAHALLLAFALAFATNHFPFSIALK